VIYDFAIEDNLGVLNEKYKLNGNSTLRRHIFLSHATRRRREYTSLTQVCHKICTEFFPLHSAHAVFTVELSQLDSYGKIHVYVDIKP